MQEETDDLAGITTGERVFYDPMPGGPLLLTWSTGTTIWQMNVRGDALNWCRQLPISGPWRDWLPVPGYREGKIVSPTALPEGLWDRARAMSARYTALLAEIDADRWLPVDPGYWLRAPILGLVWAFRTSPLRLLEMDFPMGRLPALVWARPDLETMIPPAALRDEALQGAASAAGDLIAIRRGERALVYEEVAARRSTIVAAISGKVLSVTLEGGELTEAEAMNPHALVMTPEALRDRVLERRFGRTDYERRYQLEPVPEAFLARLPELARGLEKTRRQIIEEYLARIRSGMTVSGGPTTDSRWAVSFAEGGFWIEGYREGPEGLERARDPLDEAKLREMLGSYAMFGLRELSE